MRWFFVFEFSYICKECETPVRLSEACIFFLLKEGEVVEFQKGINGGHGHITEAKDYTGEGDFWREDEWNKLVDLHFDNNDGNGFAVFHQKCYRNVPPRTISDTDPRRGFGYQRRKYSENLDWSLCKVCCRKVKSGDYCSGVCSEKGILREL